MTTTTATAEPERSTNGSEAKTDHSQRILSPPDTLAAQLAQFRFGLTDRRLLVDSDGCIRARRKPSSIEADLDFKETSFYFFSLITIACVCVFMCCTFVFCRAIFLPEPVFFSF